MRQPEPLISEEDRRKRIDRLFEAMDRLHSLPLPPLTEAEVEAEIQAVREQRRQRSRARKGAI